MKIKNFFLIFLLLIFISSCQSQKTSFEPIVRNEPLNNQIINQDILPIKDPILIPKKVKVAALLPISGQNKNLGQSILNAITISIFENDKNSDVELIIFDEEDYKNNLNEAIKEIAKQNIHLVIGPIFSSSLKEILKEINNHQITIFSFSNNSELSKHDGIFLMGFLPEQQIERITSFAIDNQKNNFSIIAPNNQYGLKFSNILKDTVRRKDGNFITSELYLNNDKNLKKSVSRVLNRYIINKRLEEKELIKEEDKSYSDIIFLPESGLILDKIAKLINEENINNRPVKLVGANNWDQSSSFGNVDLFGSWFVATNPDGYRDFEKKYYHIFGKIPPRISTIGYDLIIAIVEVINNSQNRSVISWQDFVNYDSEVGGFLGVDGLFRFLPNGLVERKYYILQVENGSFAIIDKPENIFYRY